MPEVMPCPNPKCVEKLCRLAMDDNCYHFVECPTCGYHGPESRNSLSAIAAHNTIPRALRWTHEPPKVAGWYWRKETAADRAHVFHFTGNWEDYGEHWESDRVCQLPLILNGNLWAGPIPAPLD